MQDKFSLWFSLDFKPGDLVRLIEDEEISFGVGIITQIKRDLDDIKDVLSLNYLLNEEDMELFPSKPQLKILWSTKNRPEKIRHIWMYCSEVVLYKAPAES